MRSLALIAAAVCLASCAGPVRCRPEFVVQWWAPPASVAASDRLADIKSVTFIHCKE